MKISRYLPLACLALLPACSPSTATVPSGPNPIVEMDTAMGKVKIELFQDKSPITVKNFLQYVDDKHYDGTIFHRVMPNFMVQGGGFLPGPDMREKNTGPPIRNESDNGVKNKRGTIAMARTPDPNSATAQFYINVKDNPDLDAMRGNTGYAVFGKVIEGMDVVDKIQEVPTGIRARHENVPREDVMIHSIRRVESQEKQEKQEKK